MPGPSSRSLDAGRLRPLNIAAGVAHLVQAVQYLSELARSQNRFRWVEYSLSASLMIVLFAGLTGISDVAALVALFGVNASMILFGWLMETKNDPGPDADWLPFVFGAAGRTICSASRRTWC